MVVGIAAASSGRNSAWLLLALVISPLVARLLLLALPNLKTGRQWQASIQAVIGWYRCRNSKVAASKSTFAPGTLTADRFDYWIRRRVLQYWDGSHPSQRLLKPGGRYTLACLSHRRSSLGLR
jgi:hypothetical protein